MSRRLKVLVVGTLALALAGIAVDQFVGFLRSWMKPTRLQTIVAGLHSPEPVVRVTYLEVLQREWHNEALGNIRELALGDPEGYVRAVAMDTIASRCDAPAVSFLVGSLDLERDPSVLEHIGAHLADERVITQAHDMADAALRRALKARNLPVIVGAYQAFLVRLAEPGVEDVLLAAYRCCGNPGMSRGLSASGNSHLAEGVAAIDAERRGVVREQVLDATRERR